MDAGTIPERREGSWAHNNKARPPAAPKDAPPAPPVRPRFAGREGWVPLRVSLWTCPLFDWPGKLCPVSEIPVDPAEEGVFPPRAG